MVPTFLRPTPASDPRPDPFCDAVLTRAANARLDEIKAWMKPRLPALSDDEVRFALRAALHAGGADGFRASCTLKAVFDWPVDMELCGYLRDTCHAMAFALRVETREWSVRIGLRFPGKSEDRIEWLDDQDVAHVGKVISTDHGLALGIVQAYDGTIRAGAPRRVLAERVTANLTQALYGAGVSDLESRLRQGLALPPSGKVLLVNCPDCHGDGVIPLPDQDMLGVDCETCDGQGMVEPEAIGP